MRLLRVHIMLFLLMAPSLLMAEAVFLKDGSIVEGEIVTNTATTVVINSEGKERTFRGRDILRVSYRDDYKNRKYIYLKNDQVIEGYIVGEDRYNYVVRKELESADEQKVNKNRVNFVARKRIGSIAEPSFIINGDRSLFRNFLGFRFTSGVSLPNGANTPANPRATVPHWAPLGVGAFYYDRFFEAELDIFPRLNGFGGMRIVLTGLPFTLFEVGLGVNFGIMIFESFPAERVKPVDHEILHYDSPFIQVGLSYRLPNLFRISFSYLASVEGTVEYPGLNYEFEQYSPGLNFALDAEFFIWKGLSLRLSWILIYQKFEEPLGGPDELYINNTILLSVGYGFRLAK